MFVSLGLLFGNPFISDIIYTEEAGQSAKAITVWLTLEPLPAVTPFWDDIFAFSARRIAVHGLLLLWSLGLVVIYAVLEENLHGSRVRKGFWFGIGVWWVVFLFFEPWVPFNMFGEPFRLMVLELALQFVAMTATGLTIAFIYRPANPDS
jgi:hypothetical protein